MGDEKEQHAEQGGNPVADSVSDISKADRCLAHATGILRRGSIVVQSRVVEEQKENTHTHSPTSSVRPLLIVLYELVGKIPARIGEEDWNHSIRHGGDVERGG